MSFHLYPPLTAKISPILRLIQEQKDLINDGESIMAAPSCEIYNLFLEEIMSWKVLFGM